MPSLIVSIGIREILARRRVPDEAGTPIIVTVLALDRGEINATWKLPAWVVEKGRLPPGLDRMNIREVAQEMLGKAHLIHTLGP